jgi:hypothetical protein
MWRDVLVLECAVGYYGVCGLEMFENHWFVWYSLI